MTGDAGSARWRGLAVAVLAQAVGAGIFPGLAGIQLPPEAAEAVHAEIDGRAVSLPVSRHRAYPVVDASGLAPVWLDLRWSGVFLQARLLGEDIAFEAGSPYFRHGTRTYQLPNPPYEEDGVFWLPAGFITGWLADRTSRVVVASPASSPSMPDDEPASAPGNEPPDDEPADDDPLPARVDPTVPWRVIIDPGHGGRDPGTLGSGRYEKDIVLAIGRRLHEELRAREMIEPHLTRDTDVYLEHDLRSQFAVDRGGDLFVSIHANAAADERARGFETIFLGPARSEEAREVALRENRGPEVDGAASPPSDIQFILTGQERTENLDESRRFAGFVQNSIRAAMEGRSPDRGVKQGPWWVLLGALARMPSVIVEVGFLSNGAEARFLNGAEGQGAVARAIADAIVAYREDVFRRYAPAPEGPC